jgi:hypothetical protein
LLRARDGWTRLHTDLALLRDPDLSPGAEQDIRAWLATATGLYTKPPEGWRTDMEAALGDLDPALARELRFALGFTN